MKGPPPGNEQYYMGKDSEKSRKIMQVGGSQTPNFGYVKRSTGCGGGGGGTSVSNTKYSIPIYANGKVMTAEEFKAAHAALAMQVSGQQTPKTRTKVKVSGGTQTPADLGGRHSSLGHAHQQYPQESEYYSSSSTRNSGSFAYKSLSLTTPTATQLSQNLRERILGSQSLPKGATSADYAALLAAIQQQNQQIYGTPNLSKERMSRYFSCKAMNDGNSEYSEIQNYAQAPHPNGGGVGGGGQYSWMRHSTGYASSITSAPTRLIGGKVIRF